MSTPISRATFLKGLGATALAAIFGKILWDSNNPESIPTKFPCRLLGPNQKVGHRLRGTHLFTASGATASSSEKRVVIVGSGIAGLSAAWWLQRNGVKDFVILDLEDHAGGNSASGKNQYSAYPWGAHYIPIANDESRYVRELFEELKIIQSYSDGKPVYDELALCHDPQDRLFKDGAFHDGLVPRRGLQAAELNDIGKFFEVVTKLRKAKGKDGKPAFAIPLDLSSQDDEYLKLDRISMKDWLLSQSLTTAPLTWYVNYCCRDDYGSTIENVSAWAGLHYFAGRKGTSANSEPNAVLTWPQGNGYLVERLKEFAGDRLKLNALVANIESRQSGVEVTYLDGGGESQLIHADYVICAAPRFIAAHIVKGIDSEHAAACRQLNYAPWMVANISLKRLPGARGQMPAWDNVSYYSDSLGYVVANHQEISTRAKPTVITYYYPMARQTPKAGRQALEQANADEWAKLIVSDLENMHPTIASEILSIDLWPWGHGMISPGVGFIWGPLRGKMKESLGRVHFAHSDMSGISNFEEAQYHGVEAARAVLAKLERGDG
jgi:monoamine oxidase